jgi:PKD repeat protein
MTDSRRRARSLWSLSALLAIVACLGLVPAGASAADGDIGIKDQSWTGTLHPTGTKRPASELWFNDGIWWANMWDTRSLDFHIFRLNTNPQACTAPQTSCWQDTGVLTDPRANTAADTLWDGNKLYIASHARADAFAAGFPANLYRFSYNAVTKTYTRDAGFPVQINNEKTETLVIDKDSTGRLWATWMQDNQIFVNRTLGTPPSDTTWGTPFALPAAHSAVATDDISSLIAFNGKIGVMWGNQKPAPENGFYFAVHNDTDPDTTWQATQTVISGAGTADDHINLKTDGTRVFAAVKTSKTSATLPLTELLVRDAAGTWTRNTIARVSDCPNRPIVVLDNTQKIVHVFETGPSPGGACTDTGGTIYEKTAPLPASGPITFPAGSGTPVLRDAAVPNMHNVTASKQAVSPTTGLAVLAVNTQTKFYWHEFDTLKPGAPVAQFTTTPNPPTGTAPLAVQFTDQSTQNPTSWSWDFGDGTTATVQNPSHTYAAAGTYTVTLTATNANGSGSTTKTNLVTVTAAPAPTASFSTTPSPASGASPLIVAFKDTSSGGTPTSWSWDFGDGSAVSTEQNPTHTFTCATPPTCTYTVTFTATNATGSSTATGTVSVDAALNFTPTDDGYVAQGQPATVFGGNTLRVRENTAGTSFRTYMKFTVSGLGTTATRVKSVTLRLFVTDASPDSGSVYAIADTTWKQASLTWNTAPAIPQTPIAGFVPAVLGQWVQITLPAGTITGDGTYSFALKSNNTNLVAYNSREAATNKPQLVIALNS